MAQYAVIMSLAGIGIPILAALNAALGAKIGSPIAAAFVLFIIAGLSAATVMIMAQATGSLKALPTAPKHLLLGGMLIAFYVLSITWIAPSFGLGNAVFFVLLGQLISAAAIDHFGLFNALPTPLTPTRAAGLAIMVVGVFETQKG